MQQAAKKDTQSVAGPINGEKVGFPGSTAEVDSPFNVSEGLPLLGGLREAGALLDSAWEILNGVANKLDNGSSRAVHFWF
ncbi:MAG: hypothetical protein Q8M37_10065 [Nevskia sp.]|nr:hypothetical protein [Nevskia sp.]